MTTTTIEEATKISVLLRQAAHSLSAHPDCVTKNGVADSLRILFDDLADAAEEHEVEEPTPGLTDIYCKDEQLAADVARSLLA